MAWSYFPSHSAAVKGTKALRKLKYPLQGINGVLDPNKSDRTIAGFEVVSGQYISTFGIIAKMEAPCPPVTCCCISSMSAHASG